MKQNGVWGININTVYVLCYVYMHDRCAVRMLSNTLSTLDQLWNKSDLCVIFYSCQPYKTLEHIHLKTLPIKCCCFF